MPKLALRLSILSTSRRILILVLSDDRQVAGHLLECSLEDGTIDIDYQDRVTVRFPQTPAFGAANFSTGQ